MATPKTPTLAVDRDHLDRELTQIAEDHYAWSIRLANAKATAAQADNSLRLIRSQVVAKVRANPIQFGIARVTGTAIDDAVEASPHYQTALEEFRQAQHAVEVIGAMVYALITKRQAISDLVKLFLGAYYSTPTSTETSHARDADRRNRRRPTVKELLDVDDEPEGEVV